MTSSSRARIVILCNNENDCNSELSLVLQGILMIRTSVETKHNLFWTTEISTLKPWATSWCNECQAKPSEILVNWTSIKLCVFKRKVENLDSQSNNQKLNAERVFRNDLIKHLRQKLKKKCRFVALHLTNYSFVQSRHPQAILQAV